MTRMRTARASVTQCVASGVAAVAIVVLVACAPSEPMRQDLVGTWTLPEGGTIHLGSDGVIEVDRLAVSPLDGSILYDSTDASGTWTLRGAQLDVVFTTVVDVDELVEPGATSSTTMRVVERDGELQLEICDCSADIRYHLERTSPAE